MHALFHWLVQMIIQLVSPLEYTFLPLAPSSRYSMGCSTIADLTRSKTDLIAENVLLRQPLIVLPRQVKKPTFSQSDRLWLILLASRVKNGKETLLILIQQMAQENRLWGAE